MEVIGASSSLDQALRDVLAAADRLAAARSAVERLERELAEREEDFHIACLASEACS